ncbi:hypothetical protein Tco_0608249, partial [Tanacetum coccineum]
MKIKRSNLEEDSIDTLIYNTLFLGEYECSSLALELEFLGGASTRFLRKGLVGCGEDAFLEEKGEEFSFDSIEDEVVPRVEDVSLVDGVLEGEFGGDEDDDFAIGDGKLEWKPWKKKKKKMEKNEEGGDYLIKRWCFIFLSNQVFTMDNTNPPSPPKSPTSLIEGKSCKLNSFLESLNLVPPSSNIQFVCTNENDGDVMFVELIKKYDDSSKDELEEDNNVVARELLGNFTYVSGFLIVEDISSAIDPSLSQIVLGKPFVEVSNMTYD